MCSVFSPLHVFHWLSWEGDTAMLLTCKDRFQGTPTLEARVGEAFYWTISCQLFVSINALETSSASTGHLCHPQHQTGWTAVHEEGALHSTQLSAALCSLGRYNRTCSQFTQQERTNAGGIASPTVAHYSQLCIGWTCTVSNKWSSNAVTHLNPNFKTLDSANFSASWETPVSLECSDSQPHIWRFTVILTVHQLRGPADRVPSCRSENNTKRSTLLESEPQPSTSLPEGYFQRGTAIGPTSVF